MDPIRAYWKHRYNYHLKPQSEIVDDYEIDYFIRFHKIDQDWEYIRDTLNVGPLLHLNEGPGGDWRAHNWSRILTRYEKDFELCSEWTY